MAITGHTGIPPFLNVFATPSVSIAATTEAPYCSGADVTFNATIVAPALQYLNTYYFTINGITASGKVLTMTTNSLVDGDVVRFVMVHKNGSVYYSNSIVAAVELCINYGLLYNWYAATDERNITSGDTWTIPFNTDFDTLITYLGGYLIAGGKLKEIGFINWDSPNTGATNQFNFSAKGAGIRDYYNFIGLLKYGFFWSRSQYSTWVYGYHLAQDASHFSYNLDEKYFGFSLRLVRPAVESEQILPDGTYCTPYVGNDGKSYRTVKIGTQVWTAENLAETKFRNGNYLHGYEGGSYQAISNANWAALTTEGVCCYNDDINLI